MKTHFLGLLFFFAATAAHPAVYECPATQKYDFGTVYSKEYFQKYKPSTRIEELTEGAFLSRCSYAPSARRVTCDRYKVDHVEFDRNIGAKKFYVFRSHFDFQIFKDLSSVENNGRGSVQYGQCKLVAP